MSYFICGFQTKKEDNIKLEKYLYKMVPEKRKESVLRYDFDSTYFVCFGNNKIIQNITIIHNDQKSWLAIIGTPLIQLKTELEKQVFISNFFKKPSDFLLNKIDGNFAVLAYEASQKKIIAATDFNTTIPIFYSSNPEGVFFSSHELALAKLLKKNVSPLGFSQHIHIGTSWRSDTRFKDIKKMVSTEILNVVKRNKITTKIYWRPEYEPVWKDSLNDQVNRWNSLVSDSVQKYYECSGKKPVICDCTAGEDSRLLIAHCHALTIPFKAQVMGLHDSIDVIFAKKAANKIGVELIERRKYQISEKQLLDNVVNINLLRDGFQEIFSACSEFATNNQNGIDDFNIVKYCGVPGGEAFRGAYYTRGKAIFPSRNSSLDYYFFTKMKFLLDYHQGLLKFPDKDFLEATHNIVLENLNDVINFTLGTQIDHMLRIFQTCNLGLKYKNPLYLPFATNKVTRSIYSLLPKLKKGGKLTKACTEQLFPELAFLKTQNGVPTIKKTFWRTPLFFPEYLASAKKISSGAISRLLKLTQANKSYYRLDWNKIIFTTLLNKLPYSKWFSSPATMLTGDMYNPDIINPLLKSAKSGICRHTPVLNRIITQELASRWVYDNELSE